MDNIEMLICLKEILEELKQVNSNIIDVENKLGNTDLSIFAPNSCFLDSVNELSGHLRDFNNK